jgi:DNA-binding transcriptional LysR family regulator
LDGLACTLDFVAQTEWLALLPAAVACCESRGSRVRFNPIAGEEIALDYFAVHARTEPLSGAAQSFVDGVAAELNRSRRQRGTRVELSVA